MDTNLIIFGQLVNTPYLNRIDNLIKHWRIGVNNTSKELTDLNIISMYTWMIIKLGTTTELVSSEIIILVNHLVTLLNVSISSTQLNDLVDTIMDGIIYDNYETSGNPQQIGVLIPNYNVSVNISNVFRYERTLSIDYEATGLEGNTIIIPGLINSTIVQITKETQPLASSSFTFDKITGELVFTDALNQYEKIFIIYGLGTNVLL